MKWFKHDTNALTDAKIEKLIARHSILGYGIFFAIIELIAQRLEPNNPKIEIEHDVELLSRKFCIQPEKINEIIQSLIELGLLQNTSNGIACYKLLERLDNTLSQNPEIKKILFNFRKPKPEKIDKPKKEPELQVNGDVIGLIVYFKDVNKLQNFNPTPERIKIITTCMKKGRTIEQIKKAMSNFSQDTWVDRPKYMDLIYAIGVRNKVDNFERWFNADIKQIPKKW